MKKQKLILPIIILFSVMTLVLAGEATMTVPADDGNYTTTLSMILTTDNTFNMTNITCYYNASGGGVDKADVFTEILNTTDGQTAWTKDVALSSVYTDAKTYNISCDLYGGAEGTTFNITLSAGSVTFDSTDPSITVTRDYSEITLHRILKYSTSISDATAGLDGNEVCNITNPRGVVTDVSTSALISDSIFDDTGITGNYTLACYAADTAGNADIESTSFEVKSTGPLIRAEEEVKGISGFFDVIKNIISGIVEAIGNILSGFKK